MPVQGPRCGAPYTTTLDVTIGMNAHLSTLGISVESIAARGLRECQEATELECAEIGIDGRKHLLVPAAAEAWRRLRSAEVRRMLVIRLRFSQSYPTTALI